MKKKNINVRSTEQTIKLLKSVAKKMKLSQSEVISTALNELNDLLIGKVKK
jgi:aryl-phospho-beta-D-glucosidase BglC (GH1 family)